MLVIVGGRRTIAVLMKWCRLRCLHRSKLPEPLRRVGDDYIKAEFRAHLNGQTTADQWGVFVREWNTYAKTLDEGTSPKMNVDGLLDVLSPDQAHQLGKLYRAAKVVRSRIINENVSE